MAGTDIAIDLGSANFRLYVDGKGVVVDEPNVIAVDEDSNRVVAVGRRAYKMLGRTSDRVRVVKPVTGGVISDLTLMDATLQHYLKKVTKPRFHAARRCGGTERHYGSGAPCGGGRRGGERHSQGVLD